MPAGAAADPICMTSTVSLAFRLPGARGLGVQEPAAPRHMAPNDGVVRIVEAGPDLTRPGRHAEPEWSRLAFDAKRDEDAFDWLGFSSELD
jgi:hypothetical protein